jgi:hypothetical protein
MFARRIFLALTFMAGITSACAQVPPQPMYFPQPLPPQSVIGNPSGASGNAVAVPFSQLQALLNVPTAAAADGTIYSNISGFPAAPSNNNISAVLDKLFGTTQGSLAYRGASGWNALTPGTAGQALSSGGPAANPSWAAASSLLSKSGNTTQFATIAGSLASGHFASIDGSGNLVDSGIGTATASTPYTDAKTAGLLNNGKAVADGAMAAGSTTLTSATANFAANDVGKLIAVQGAAASGNDLSTTIAGFTNSTTVTLAAANASGGSISGKQVYWGSNNSATLNSLITSLCKGTIWFDPGIYMFGSTVNITTGCASGIHFIGSGSGAGTAISQRPATVMLYAGTAPFIKISNSMSNTFEHFQFQPIINNYSGATVQITNATGSAPDPSYNVFQFNTFVGAASCFSGSCANLHFDLNKSIETTIRNNSFYGGEYAISGGVISGGGYTNSLRIEDNEFFSFLFPPIIGGGEAWIISGNTFEQLFSGAAGAFTSTETQRGMLWSGNWFGDVTVNGGQWINVTGFGFSFTGNRLASNSTTSNVGIALNGVKGFSITGNDFQFMSIGISPSSTPDGGTICGNSYHSVTTFIAGGFGTNVNSSTCNVSY